MFPYLQKVSGACALLAFFLTAELHAESLSQTSEVLSWRAPPECPQEDYIEAQVNRWLGKNYRLDDSEILAQASVSWVEERWVVELFLQRGKDESTREVTVATCTEAADFVALTIALLENPELVTSEQDESQQALAESSPESSEGGKQELESAFEQPSAPAQESKEEIVFEQPGPPKPVTEPLSWSLGAGVGVVVGVFPQAAAFGFVRAGLRPGPWRMSSGLSWIPRTSYQAPEAENEALFGRLTGRLLGCRYLALGVFAAGPCVGAELGVLSVREADAATSNLFWAGTQLLLGTELAFSWGGGFLELGAQIPLTRHSFVLSEGTPVHESRPGFEGKMGISIFL